MTAVDIGRYQLGAEVPLVLQCRAPTGAHPGPDVPATHPTVEVRRDDGGAAYVYHGRVAADDQAARSGFFRMPLPLDARFAAGRHRATFRWTDSGANARVLVHQFEVVGGGSADGTAVAMHHVSRPDANRILTQTDGGLLKVGTNPR